nr:carbohydrate ABC transporter permease [Chloroflexota bacterium]
MVSNPLSYRGRQRANQLAGYGTMLLLIVIVGAPLFWMLSGSLKTTREIYTFPPIWIPDNPRWANFRDAWEAAPFGQFYINSIIITLAGMALELVNSTMSAYALAFLRFPKKNLVFVLILIALMVPNQVTILPNYLTLANVFGQSWINTYQGIVLPGASVAFGTFLLRQSFLGLPREVLDAARVDGCGHLRLLWDIVIPMSRP